MSRKKKQITTGQAAKILGVSTQTVRNLAKEGVLSSVQVKNGTVTTYHFYEAEVKERKRTCNEYLSIAKSTEELLRTANEEKEQALAEEKQARNRFRAAKTWQATQRRLSETLCAFLKNYDGTLSQREEMIIQDLVCLMPLDVIAQRFQLTTTRVSEIIMKGIRKIVRGKYLVTKNDELLRENALLRQENKELKERNDYLAQYKNEPVPDEKIYVLSNKDYAIRQTLLQPVSILTNIYPYPDAADILMKNGIKTLADLVILSDGDLKAFGLSQFPFTHRLGSMGLSFGMNLAPYGLASDIQMQIVNERFKKNPQENPQKTVIREKLLGRVADRGLSVRAYNCLRAADIVTFADLCEYRLVDLMKFRNFGRKSLREVQALVEKQGLSFGMDVSEYGITPKKKH